MSGALKSRSTFAARVGGAFDAPPSCAAATRDAAIPAINADADPTNSRRLIFITSPLIHQITNSPTHQLLRRGVDWLEPLKLRFDFHSRFHRPAQQERVARQRELPDLVVSNQVRID